MDYKYIIFTVGDGVAEIRLNRPEHLNPLSAAAAECERRGLRHKVGNLLSSDCFYGESGIPGTLEWRKLGVLAVEMEAAALYANAARAGKKALCICTISDLVETGSVTTAEQRQTAFHDMMQVALAIA